MSTEQCQHVSILHFQSDIAKNHTKDPQIQVHKIYQASHMQFRRDSMHRSHSSEEISPEE